MMSDIYNEEYYKKYCGPIPYERNYKEWLEFFGNIADFIIETFRPKRVLDVGCAKGFLVECLRDRGVEAYGFDISEYAISQVREDIKPYVWVQSVTEPIKEKYDLITCIEVLEHIPEEYIHLAIRNMTNSANVIIFSSTSSDYEEKTHVSVKSNIEWILLFAKYGFVVDYRYDITKVISKDAFVLSNVHILERGIDREMAYIKEKNTKLEEVIRKLEKEIEEYKVKVQNLEEDLNRIYDSTGWKVLVKLYRIRDKIFNFYSMVNRFLGVILKLRRLIRLRNIVKVFETIKTGGIKGTIDLVKSKISSNYMPIKVDSVIFETNMADAIQYSPNEPLEFTIKVKENNLFRIDVYTRRESASIDSDLYMTITDIRKNKVVRKVTLEDEKISNDGFTSFKFAPIKDSANREYKISIRSGKSDVSFLCSKELGKGKKTIEIYDICCKIYAKKVFESIYEAWIDKNEPKENELMIQRKTRFKYEPKISIIVPTYNTPEKFLIEMIESVRNQTYGNWELCIADGGSNERVRNILRQYALEDNRIKIKLLGENKGIAGNSNEALSLATGEYIALLDHDDMLPPFALFEVVKTINENPDADFIYSDEDKISKDGKKRFDPHFKPDWSPYSLRSYNYITHLSVFKNDLIKQVGGFREGYDGSQDYDLILRASERAKKIVHIPKVLYHWRISENSTALNPKAKLYAYEAAKKALNDHLKRLNIKGYVEDGLFLGSYRVRYILDNSPLVSIIITNKDKVELLKECIDSIVYKSTYSNYEIIICENNSEEKKTFEYYDELISHYNNIRIVKWDKPFNYAAANNFAVKYAKGDVFVFLNNDTKVITNDWLENMLELTLREDVGIVGAKLLYENDTIQHAGVVVGLLGVAGHIGKNKSRNYNGHMGNLLIIRNVSAVTGACLMIKRHVFDEVGGFDERFVLAFNDIDLCLKVREKGYNILFTPYAELYHYESETRGYENTPEKQERFKREIDLFKQKWHDILMSGDPYFNKNFDLSKEDFIIKV